MTERTEYDKLRKLVRQMDDYDIFEMRKKGHITRLPINFWDKSTARNIIRIEIKKYVEVNLKGENINFSENELANEIRKSLCAMNFRKVFKELQMTCALEQFNSSPYEMIKYCFNELDIMPWELSTSPDAYWNDENVAGAMRWVMKKTGLMTREAICENFTCNVLRENGLKTLFDLKTLYELVQLAVPEMNIQPWELKKMFKWDKPTAKKAIIWMIEEKLHWNYQDVCNNISTRTFDDNGLGGMLSHCCNHSTFDALELAYPGKYSKNCINGYTQKNGVLKLNII